MNPNRYIWRLSLAATLVLASAVMAKPKDKEKAKDESMTQPAPVVERADAPVVPGGQMTVPTTLPATQASTTQPFVSRITGKPLPPPPAPYAVLGNRTVFMKTRIPPPPPVASTQPAMTGTSAARAESTLVFNGVTEVDGVAYAVFEDTAGGKILGFKAGDAIASGKITGLSLDGLDYEAGGKTTHIFVGQTLDGGEAPDIVSRATVSGGATTQPGGTSASSEDAILKTLRERRKRELGQ